jgi:hypothetical protein
MHGEIRSQYWKRHTYRLLAHVEHSVIAELLDVQADCSLLSPTVSAGGFASLRGPLCKTTLREVKSRDGFADGGIEDYPTLQMGEQVLKYEKDVMLRLDGSNYSCELDANEQQLYLLLCRSALLSDISRYSVKHLGTPYYGAGDYE